MASISPASDNVAISLRGVSKHYGALHAVDGVDLDIPKGEIFGLIGHNGAGKSTLFKMMLGLVKPTQGTLLVAGAQVGGRGFRAARRQLGYLPENVVLYDNLDGLETLHFFARLKGAPLAECPVQWIKPGTPGVQAGYITDAAQPRFTVLAFAPHGTVMQALQGVASGLHAKGVAAQVLPVQMAALQEHGDLETLVDADCKLAALYGAMPGAVYVLRPDGHVLGRWQGGRHEADDLAASIDTAIGHALA